jgi:hypothetical protein
MSDQKRRLLRLFMDYGETKRQIGEQQGKIEFIRGFDDAIRRTHQHIEELEDRAREISVEIDAVLGDAREKR